MTLIIALLAKLRRLTQEIYTHIIDDLTRTDEYRLGH